MDIQAPETDKYKGILFPSAEFSQLKEQVKQQINEQTHFLITLIGPYDVNKADAVKTLANEAGLSIRHFDMAELVDNDESASIRRLDEIFDQCEAKKEFLFFSGGDNINGLYRGFTLSRIKYASPQERHFLKRVQEYEGITSIAVSNRDSTDETLLRASQSIIEFPLPASPLKRLGWKLRNFTFHGIDVDNARPYPEAG